MKTSTLLCAEKAKKNKGIYTSHEGTSLLALLRLKTIRPQQVATVRIQSRPLDQVHNKNKYIGRLVQKSLF